MADMLLKWVKLLFSVASAWLGGRRQERAAHDERRGEQRPLAAALIGAARDVAAGYQLRDTFEVDESTDPRNVWHLRGLGSYEVTLLLSDEGRLALSQFDQLRHELELSLPREIVDRIRDFRKKVVAVWHPREQQELHDSLDQLVDQLRDWYTPTASRGTRP